jgi:hypothetical protein
MAEKPPPGAGVSQLLPGAGEEAIAEIAICGRVNQRLIRI